VTSASPENTCTPPGAVDRTGADRAAIYDVSVRDDVHFLHKHAIGLWGVLFLTVTGAAPISAMLFNTPVSVGYGNGLATPAGFAFATIILTIFSVGYVEMSRRVTAAGGFYSFISHGGGLVRTSLWTYESRSACFLAASTRSWRP